MADRIKEITEKIKKFRDERDWDKFHNPKEEAIDLAVEAAEVLEHFQWRSGKDLEEYIKTHKQEISDELADVFYCLLQLVDTLKIDLEKAFDLKMKQNEKKYPIHKVKGRPNKYSEL